MRMWMLVPNLLCDQHLLGEHVEIHMLVGALKKGKGINGFLRKGLLEPQNAMERHESLTWEMKRRGMNHASPLPEFECHEIGKVDALESLRELASRCEKCKQRIDNFMEARKNG